MGPVRRMIQGQEEMAAANGLENMVEELKDYVNGGHAYGLEAYTELIDVVSGLIDESRNAILSQLARMASTKVGPKYKDFHWAWEVTKPKVKAFPRNKEGNASERAAKRKRHQDAASETREVGVTRILRQRNTTRYPDHR